MGPYVMRYDVNAQPDGRFFFGGPFVGGLLGGLVGSAILRPRPPFYVYNGYYPYGYGPTPPGYVYPYGGGYPYY